MTSNETRHLERGIGTRQLSMIAIGGAIGTGLFFASGGMIAKPARAARCWPMPPWASRFTA